MKVIPATLAAAMGYSADKRRRRREHRIAARELASGGTFLNPGRAPVGSNPWHVSRWHLFQARHVGR